MTVLDTSASLLSNLRKLRPLVHHLTNFVTVNDCANVTIAIGGSPIMAVAEEEVADIAAISSALVLNIGTLTPDAVEAMILAGKSANKHGIPVVLDPVGAGASILRSSSAARILEQVKVAVLRGNISEIRAVSGLTSHTKGVDAARGDQDMDPGQLAADLARRAGYVVAVTGPVDAISDGKTTYLVDNGHPMLEDVSGSGCMCTSITGCFTGANPGETLLGTATAIMCMGIAGEIAFAKAGGVGLGSFRVAVMDAISRMDGETLLAMGKIREAQY